MNDRRRHFTWQGAIVESNLTPTQKLVALVVGTYMNAHGEGAWPAMQTLARDTGYSYDTVRRSLRELRAIGWLEMVPRFDATGRRTTNEYAIGWPEGTGRHDPGAPGGTLPGDPGATLPEDPGGTRPVQEEHPIRSPQVTTDDADASSPTPDEPRLVDVPDEPARLAALFADLLSSRVGRPIRVGDQWRRDMRLLIERDHRAPADVERVIVWLNEGTDEVAAFWRPNIRSQATLRARWDTMAEQYQRDRAKRTTSPAAGRTSDAVAAFLRREQAP